ncbi:MAG: PAS domain S-box protein [Planctomycetes bacterium]|nr:PAS domain S-box protein [Planctomycetota bacterium]
MTSAPDQPPYPADLYRQMVEAAPNAMILVDAAGNIVVVNSEAEVMFGYGHGEMLGLSVEELVPHRYRVIHQEMRAGFAHHPSRRRMGAGRELWALQKNGTEVPVEIGLSIVDTEAGEFVLAACVDITARRRSEESLSRYTRELKRSNQDLEDFAYIASHDLRSPLRAIDNLAAWIAEDSAEHLDADGNENLQLMRGRIRRMHQLLDDLLGYSRAGRTGADQVDLQSEDVVRNILDTIEVPAEFRIEITSRLPQLHTLATPLETCLRNLISNAIKHHDRIDGRVTVSATEAADHVVFSVTDDGPGIEAQHFDRIFKVFHTLKPRDESEGSGMGLAIIKKITERFDGKVEVESEPGKGSTFRLTWPRTVAI